MASSDYPSLYWSSYLNLRDEEAPDNELARQLLTEIS